MARKKANETGDDVVIDDSTKIKNEVTTEYGEGIITSAQSLIERPQKVISISPAIDYMLGGGITQGSWITLNGKPKSGKSSLALNMAARCQAEGMNIYYLNCEGRIKPRDLTGVKGLNVDQVKIISSTEDRILSAEAFLSIADKIICTERNVVLIIDSVSVLTEESKMLEFGKQTRAAQAKIVADFCGKNATVVPIKNSVVICITHSISNPSGMGAASIEKSPNSLVYQADYRLKVSWGENWIEGGEDGDNIGVKSHWQCLCSGLRAPGRKVVSYLRFNHGLDCEIENINFAIDFGLIAKKGAWYNLELEGCEPVKAQGIEKLRAALIEQPDVYNKLVAELKNYGIPV